MCLSDSLWPAEFSSELTFVLQRSSYFQWYFVCLFCLNLKNPEPNVRNLNKQLKGMNYHRNFRVWLSYNLEFEMASCSVTQIVDICNRGESGSLGWKPLDQGKGGSCFTWDDVCAKIHHDGMNHIPDDTWFRQPIVLRNQQLFKVPAEVLIELGQCQNCRQMNKFFQDHQFNGESRETTKIKRPKKFSKSNASSLNLTGLSDYVFPLHTKQVHWSAIIAVGRWFTDGHVEEGGDVFVSVTLLGKKLFKIASRGAVSERLFNMTGTLNSFISLVMGGPKVKCEKNVFFHMTETSDMNIQPALCAQSVLTI